MGKLGEGGRKSSLIIQNIIQTNQQLDLKQNPKLIHVRGENVRNAVNVKKKINYL